MHCCNFLRLTAAVLPLRDTAARHVALQVANHSCSGLCRGGLVKAEHLEQLHASPHARAHLLQAGAAVRDQQWHVRAGLWLWGCALLRCSLGPLQMQHTLLHQTCTHNR